MSSTTNYSLASALFLRGLGLVFTIAFVSLWLQVDILISSSGVLPAGEYLARLGNLGWPKYWYVPSLLWLSSSDTSIHCILGLGTIASLCISFGYFARISLLLTWLLWLSLLSVGQSFLSYQWDVLLLECCLLALCSYPHAKKLSLRTTPALNFFSLLLFRFLLFRLMFSSGYVKLASGDETWATLTALEYHFLSQPLPTVVAAYLHQAPAMLLKVCCFIMFVTELLLPFFVFGPRLPRLLAGIGFILFQLAIACTGNYTYFNLLSALLALLLFDNAALQRLLPIQAHEPEEPIKTSPPMLFGQPFKVVLLGLASLQLWVLVFGYSQTPSSAQSLLRSVMPLRSSNSYGLFAVMTKKRYELQFEGSLDGESWREYQLKWKPGALAVAPRLVAPHQPRIDWQLWFASLDRIERNPWLLGLALKILNGDSEATAVFDYVPFDKAPPKYIRILRYEYTFASSFVRETEERWWERTLTDVYMPAISLRESPRE